MVVKGPSVKLEDPAGTELFGAALARAGEPCVIYLQGDLGAGKTTLVRGFLRALGHEGRVKSPSFSVLECYTPGRHTVFHLDLYRLSDAGEVAYLGLDSFQPALDWLLVEWPEHGRGWLPGADIVVMLDFSGSGRLAKLVPKTPRGTGITAAWAGKIQAKTTS